MDLELTLITEFEKGEPSVMRVEQSEGDDWLSISVQMLKNDVVIDAAVIHLDPSQIRQLRYFLNNM